MLSKRSLISRRSPEVRNLGYCAPSGVRMTMTLHSSVPRSFSAKYLVLMNVTESAEKPVLVMSMP